IKDSVACVKHQAVEHKKRLGETEMRIMELEESLTNLLASQQSKDKMIVYLEAKVDDLANHSQCNNLRIVGIPEGPEGRDLIAFTQKLLSKVLGGQAVLEVEHAHRALRPQPDKGERPRPLILHLLRSKDKEAIMRAAWKCRKLLYETSPYYIFQDFSVELNKKRVEYSELKYHLQKTQFQYGLLYPVKFFFLFYRFPSPYKSMKEYKFRLLFDRPNSMNWECPVKLTHEGSNVPRIFQMMWSCPKL
uniref:L1 transposable element RRM domain-containing protein n=1 Tax=Latimeria chalumnae TaxID=7897 RepID=H3A590_LATCH